MKYSFICIAFALWFSPDDGYSQEQALPQLTVDMVNEIGNIVLGNSEEWKYQPGDDLMWADPDFDDSGWYDLAPVNLGIDAMPDSLWDGYGWWRFTFTADSSFYAETWNLIFSAWGDAEVYLDGELVHRAGNFSIYPDEENTYSLRNIIFLPVDIYENDKHTIAIRYSHHQAKQYSTFFKKNTRDLGFGLGFGTLPHLTADRVNENGFFGFSSHVAWKYQPGDDLRWADPEFDDSGWKAISPGQLSFDAMPDSLWDGFGWWRFTFTADSSFYAENWNLIFSAWGAAEVYLDGELVQRAGNFSIYPDEEKTYSPVNQIHPPIKIYENDKHTIAVRYSYHQAKRYNVLMKENAGDLGFGLAFGTHAVNQFYAQRIIYSSFTLFFSSAVLFVLFLLHLMLYFKFPEDRSNLFISIIVGLLLISDLAIFSFVYLNITAYWYTVLNLIWKYTVSFAFIFLPYVAIKIFRLEELNKVIWLIAGSPLLLLSDIFAPGLLDYIALFLFSISFSLLGYICWRAYKRGKRGVHFVAFGVLGTLILALIYMLNSLNLIEINFGIYSVMITSLYTLFPLGMTLYVADSYGYLFTSMENEVSDRTRELQETSKEISRQAAADRIRAEISSMRNIRDLQKITPLIWKELNVLGVPFSRCGTFIVDEKAETVQMHLSNPDGKALAATTLTFSDMDYIGEALQHWQNRTIFTTQWNAERLVNWTRMLADRGLIDSTDSYLNSATHLESLHLHFIPFKQGMLYVGSNQPLDSDELKNIEELAEAFSVAYARYEDFTQLEEKNNELLSALQNLEAAQEQLVQQEKLASLGQLTAGIAHEIKNPLNFVNNFSDVSLEMIDEALEEIRQIGENQHATETAGILADIKANLTKIHEHGSRADSIVKSMLQHSRGGDGKMEPTDLNALVKEFTNLSYHGMRAGKDAIDVDIELDLDKTIGDVPLIAEDFSRVILNLCNNAFDAMSENAKGKCAPSTSDSHVGEKSPFEGGADPEGFRGQVGDVSSQKYEPKLTVRTRSKNGSVTIEIEDNGPGIPDEIKDKILQPFFTTKKGTQGTGLGLSITNDIIKAHGGQLSISSSPGDGSTFTIQLPL